MNEHRLLRAGGAILMIASGSLALAQDAGAPLKLGVGRPYGKTQTNSMVADPQVDGKLLRVVVTRSEKPWDAGVNSVLADKLSAGDRVKATFWLRATNVAPGATPQVQLAIQESAAPFTVFGKPLKASLTDKFAPYVVEAVVPRSMPGSKVSVAMQLGFATQTIDVAGVQAVKLPSTAR